MCNMYLDWTAIKDNQGWGHAIHIKIHKRTLQNPWYLVKYYRASSEQELTPGYAGAEF